MGHLVQYQVLEKQSQLKETCKNIKPDGNKALEGNSQSRRFFLNHIKLTGLNTEVFFKAKYYHHQVFFAKYFFASGNKVNAHSC